MDTTYTLLPNGMILRSDDATIPPDPGNRDFQGYLVWRAEGHEPELAPEPELPSPPPLPSLEDLVRRIEALEEAVQRGRE